MAFKDNFRIEKIYFQRVKDDAQTLNSWKNEPRLYSSAEISAIAKDACDSVLMLYKLVGEAWNDAINHIEKLSAELDALKATSEAYHDELNEKIDEVNNYLNSSIRELDIRLTAAEEKLENLIPANSVALRLEYDETSYNYNIYNGDALISYDDIVTLTESYAVFVYMLSEANEIEPFIGKFAKRTVDYYDGQIVNDMLKFDASVYFNNGFNYLRDVEIEISKNLYGETPAQYVNLNPRDYNLHVNELDFALMPIAENLYSNCAGIVFMFYQIGTNYRVRTIVPFNEIYSGISGGTQSSNHHAPFSYIQLYISGVQQYKVLPAYKITCVTDGNDKIITGYYFDPDNASTPIIIDWTYNTQTETETVTRIQ